MNYLSSKNVMSSEKEYNLRYIGANKWLITPSANFSYYAFRLRNAGNIGDQDVSNTSSVFPALYLKSDVTIKFGVGTISDPYVLSWLV